VSYCVNPTCTHPENPPQELVCVSCGNALRLRDRYRASRPLGKGGFGATFLAADEGLPGCPSSVIKQLRPNTQSASVLKMARELFEREATTLGRIGSHPQIPRLVDYFEEEGNFYLVQEYVEGETLKQEYERRGVFSEPEIRKVLSEMLPALAFMHNNGVIHRDIKPANIIRRKQDGQLVLIDFGAVSSQVNKTTIDEDDEDPSGLLTNFAIGTPGFAPPEQMAMRPVFSSDIYATAMCCMYLMTGRSPKDFPHDPFTGEINWKSQVQVSENLKAVFDKMLQQSVTQRFRSAGEVLAALETRLAQTQDAGVANPYAAGNQFQSISTTKTPPPNSRIQSGNRSSSSQISEFGSGMFATTEGTRSQAKIGDLKGGRRILAEYASGKRNFANLDLSKISLGSSSLPGIVMSRSKLAEADLCHADLSKASFQGANMSQTKLSGANLKDAKMQRVILFKADLGRASLIQADMREANLQSAYMSKTDLSGANLTGANLKGAYMMQANLRGANLQGANLLGAKVSDEQLSVAKTNWATIRPDGSKKLF
jgi:serine/threonine protein kinase, bacterial